MEGSLESHKFSEELHWCISQLELGLQRQSPDSRQAAESVKVLKILKSKKAPLVKKRQVMRNAFGDYRKKMKDAEKKSFSGLRHSRFQSLGLMKAPIASRFLKLSHNKQQNIDQVRGDLNITLNNLHLHSSQVELSTSPKTVEFASSLGSGLDRQAYHNLHSPGSSVREFIRNASTSATVQSDQFIHTGNIQSSSQSSKVLGLTVSQNQSYVVNTSKSSHTAPPLSSHSNNVHMNSNNSSKSSLTQESTSSTHGNLGSFKYEPSDNSFMFGFDSSESTSHGDMDEMVVKEAEAQGSIRTNNFTQEVHDKNLSSIYKYEKSENDFCFNFEVPKEEL